MKKENKLIQEFLGFPTLWWNDPDPIEDNDYGITFMQRISDEIVRIQYGGGSEAEVLPNEIEERIYDFHKDWNLLMNAIEEIEKLGFNFSIDNCYVKIWDGGQSDFVKEISEPTKIMTAHKGVVEFIKWYNKL